MELSTFFRGLLTKIEPNTQTVAKAKKAHETLRGELRNDEEISKADPETYLAGSYARDTAIKDIKDVDIILLLDVDHNTTSPEVVVAWLQSVLQNYYSEVNKQGRSVQVVTDSGFQLDVVLSEPMVDKESPIWIPDRDAGRWVASHPKGQIDFGVRRNASTDGCYKPLVKAMKHWRDRLSPEAARVKSYILESLVSQAITSKPDSYAQGVVRILETIDNNYSAYVKAGIVPNIPDPGYPTVNVAKRWQFEEFASFMRNVSLSRTIAVAAFAESDRDRSIALWRKLFGPEFSSET
jgi:predicted nucleotidyltransferase